MCYALIVADAGVEFVFRLGRGAVVGTVKNSLEFPTPQTCLNISRNSSHLDPSYLTSCHSQPSLHRPCIPSSKTSIHLGYSGKFSPFTPQTPQTTCFVNVDRSSAAASSGSMVHIESVSNDSKGSRRRGLEVPGWGEGSTPGVDAIVWMRGGMGDGLSVALRGGDGWKAWL
jgi:hypothetical protein